MNRYRLDCDKLGLVFERCGDRWLHRFVVSGNESEVVILSSEDCHRPSQETNGDRFREDWPPSPPLQELDLHRLGLDPSGADRLAVLGVGKAGSSHWSASFSLTPENGSNTSNPTRAILVEIACLSGRASDESPNDQRHRWLSTYRINEAATVEQAGLSICVSLARFQVLITPLITPPWGSDCNPTVGEILIRPQLPSLDPRKSTCWGYRVEMLD